MPSLKSILPRVAAAPHENTINAAPAAACARPIIPTVMIFIHGVGSLAVN